MAAPILIWSATAGTVDDAGLFTAPNGSDVVTVTVECDTFGDDSTVTVTNHSPTIESAAAAVQVPATATISLSVYGADADPTGEVNLTYTWTAHHRADWRNGNFRRRQQRTNDGKTTVATVDMLGDYEFQVTITDGDGLSVTSSVEIEVVQTLTTITVNPASATVDVAETQQFTAVGYDQFGDLMTTPPMFNWGATAGSIDLDGLYTAPRVCMPATVTASSESVTGTATVTINNPSPTTSCPARR